MGAPMTPWNLGGIKVSSAEIDACGGRSPRRKETAAVAINPPGGGPSLLVMFVVETSEKASTKTDLQPLLQRAIREKLNPLFKIDDVVIVPALPRTASQKR